jgi:ribokinase
LYEGKGYWVPAFSTKVHDTVGAGDVFNAGFLFGLTKGWKLQKCMAFGNATASLYISRESGRRYPLSEEALLHAKNNSSYQWDLLQSNL